MISIESKYLKITIKTTGAELNSLYNKETDEELLWQGNPSFWSGQAPILFPTIGSLKNNSFEYKGQKFNLNRHGFARRSTDWKIVKLNANSIQCTLTANKTTQALYPFDFLLVVTYTISKQTLNIQHSITNNGKEIMPFSIGGHPAFNCPSNANTQYSDYTLRFNEIETSHRHFINKEGLFSGLTGLTLNQTDTLRLNKNLFTNDALIFKDLKSKSVSLYRSSKKILSVTFSNFPFLGIWAAAKAPFVCIEPWIGHADNANTNQDLFTKEGSKSLPPNEQFNASYQITIA